MGMLDRMQTLVQKKKKTKTKTKKKGKKKKEKNMNIIAYFALKSKHCVVERS